MVVHSARGDEHHVGRARQASEQGRHILGESGGVGDVEHTIEAMALEPLGESCVVLAVTYDGLHTRGEPITSLAAIENGDLVALGEELAHEMQANELRAAHDEGAHASRILA